MKNVITLRLLTSSQSGNTQSMNLLLFIYLLYMIALMYYVHRWFLTVTKYCNSPACVKAAGSLLSSVDWNVDPCDDFYKFACGHWLQTQPIPQGYHHWDRFQELSGQNLYMLSQLIGKFNLVLSDQIMLQSVVYILHFAHFIDFCVIVLFPR